MQLVDDRCGMMAAIRQCTRCSHVLPSAPFCCAVNVRLILNSLKRSGDIFCMAPTQADWTVKSRSA